MNYKDITVGIVTFKSENVIFDCLKSIKYIKKIIIFDNSNDIKTKIKIKKNIQILKYSYLKQILATVQQTTKLSKSAKLNIY